MLLLSLLLALPASAFYPAVEAIYNGKPVAAGSASWKVTVDLALQDSNDKWFGCTGVFIDSDVVLTAAHCVQGVTNQSKVYVRLHRRNSATDVTWLTPSPGQFRVVAHPHYFHGANAVSGDDLAVIVLKDQEIPEDFGVVEVQTTEQARASDVGSAVTVVGVGRTETNKEPQRFLFAQGTVSTYQAGGILQITFGGFFQNVQQQGVCGGDSGGPVFVSVGKQLYLTAINTAIAADLTANCGSTLYANTIDAARYSWIQAASSRARAQLNAAK